MKLSVRLWRNLSIVLDSIPQKDLPDIASVRKNLGVYKQIEKACEKEFDKYSKLTQEKNDLRSKLLSEYEKLQPQLDKVVEPYRKEIEGLKEGLSNEEVDKHVGIQGLVREANSMAAKVTKGLDDQFVSVDDKMKKLNKEMAVVEVDVAINPEYKQFVKDNFEEKIRPAFVGAEDIVAVADALEV